MKRLREMTEHELRPHLEPTSFVDQVMRQQAEGYRLAFVDGPTVLACAGYRITENLLFGRFIYVDDLVTWSGVRSRGYGGILFDWLVSEARSAGCTHKASRFRRAALRRPLLYLTKRMNIIGHHFALKLEGAVAGS